MTPEEYEVLFGDSDRAVTSDESATQDRGKAVRAFGLLAGLAAIAAMVFIISPFDVTLRGNIGISAFERTFSPTAAGVALGIATFVVDGGSALLVALGLGLNPSWSERLDRWTTRLLYPTRKKKSAEGSKLVEGSTRAASDVSLALAVGPGAVLLKYPGAEPRRWVSLGLRYALLTSVTFGVVAWMVAGGANWMADIGFGWLRQAMIDWLPEPLLWTAVFVITVIVPFLRGEWLDRASRKDSTSNGADKERSRF